MPDRLRRPPGLVRRLLPYVSAHRGVLWASVALAIGGQALLALMPLLQQIIVDDAIGSARRLLVPWVVLLVGVGAVGFVAHVVRRYLGSRLSVDVQHDLRVV